MSRLIRRYAAAALGIVVAGLTAATPSVAAPQRPDPITFDLPAGQGCAFALHIHGEGGNRVERVSTDVHVIKAGRGLRPYVRERRYRQDIDARGQWISRDIQGQW